MFSFTKDIGMDLGTASVLIYIKDKGIVLNEPSVVALDKNTGKLLKVGADAQAMLGRTPGNIIAIRPLREGVISDYEVTERMIKEFLHKVIGFQLFKPRILIFPPEEEMTMEVKGRSLITGLPELITVSSAEMLEAFEEPVERIMEEVHLVLEKTPPELVADISNNGIVMTGGGSLVRGFDQLITARTGIHATVAENAIQCVAVGTGKSLESIQDMQDGTMNLSRRKQIN